MKNNQRTDIVFLLLICLTLMAAGTYAYRANIAILPEQAASIAPAAVSPVGEVPPTTNPSTALAPGSDSGAVPPQSAPTPTPALATYTVKSGDTLWDIAAAHHTTVAQLIELNNLSSDALSLGQTLILAGKADQASKLAAVHNAPAPTPSRSAGASRSEVLQYAARFLNTPYKYGGTTPAGFDCSGFVQYVYKHFDISLPRTAAAQASTGVRVDKSNLNPGDLVFFNTDGSGINHVGIYAGNGRFIHSSSPNSGGVIYTSMGESFYSKSYVGARRLSN